MSIDAITQNLLDAAVACQPWMAKLLAANAHLDSVLPQAAVNAANQLEAAVQFAKGELGKTPDYYKGISNDEDRLEAEDILVLARYLGYETHDDDGNSTTRARLVSNAMANTYTPSRYLPGEIGRVWSEHAPKEFTVTVVFVNGKPPISLFVEGFDKDDAIDEARKVLGDEAPHALFGTVYPGHHQAA